VHRGAAAPVERVRLEDAHRLVDRARGVERQADDRERADLPRARPDLGLAVDLGHADREAVLVHAVEGECGREQHVALCGRVVELRQAGVVEAEVGHIDQRDRVVGVGRAGDQHERGVVVPVEVAAEHRARGVAGGEEDRARERVAAGRQRDHLGLGVGRRELGGRPVVRHLVERVVVDAPQAG
jgi:hypothetical protein